MPFVLIIIGVVLLVASVRNTQGDLYTLVKGDFSGPNNYIYWLVSILIIGAVGYIPTLRPLSRIFLALVVVVLFLSHGGVFEQFNAQLKTSSPLPSSKPSSGTDWIDNFDYAANGLEQPLAPARPH